MSQWPSNILPSPNLSHRSEQSQSQSQKSLRSQGSVRGQANGMPIAESRSLEAAHILDQLQKEIVFLTGGRDRQGGPLLIFPPCRDEYFMPNDIAACLRYLIQIPSDESKRRGFTAIVDSRDGSWSNLVTLLGCLKQSLGDYLKQVLVLRSDGMGPRHSSSSSFRRDRGPNIEPQFINLNRLYTFVDRNQLIGSMGGTLMYRHSYWLQNRLDLEKFVRESRAAASHLDSAESEIQHRYRNKGPESPTSPVEALRQHQFFQDSTLSVPKQVIRDGRDLLHKLQQYNEAAMPGDGSVTTLDNLESQKQVKRTLQYIENRIDKIQNFLQDQDRSLHMNVLRDDVQKEFRQVVEWILGPGEKLLASQTDIGDSFETAEILRKRFEELEIKCADTYGHYAELRHRAEDLVRDHHASSDDIRAQRDYMDTVCRSFASRLERRRTLLITSVRFHRLTEEFTRKLDDLLGFLYDDREADTVETAQEALRQLQEKVDAIDTAANHGMRDGQSLLDEMTRPIKNAFGKDISPDYAHQIKHITQKLEELQERKMRCDDLAEVRKLKLQQTLQLRTCERDVDQAINWILELYDVMVTSHTNLGQTVQETESLHDEHRKFESAALGTYDYGKQLLQAAQVLRRSLRFELEPYNLRAQRLEDAWKKFSRGTSERANRLTVAAMFIGQSDKVYEGVEQLMVVVAQTLTGDISVLDALSRYGPEKQRVEMEHQDTDQMGRALLERLALPLVTTDGLERPLSQDEQGSTDMINGRLRKMGHKVAELNRYWSEMEQTGQPPSVQPKITRSMQSRPQGQSYYQGQGQPYSQGQRSTLPQRSQSQRSQDTGPYRGRDQPIRTQSLNKPESQGRGRVRKRPIPKQSSRRSTGEPGPAVPMDRPDTGQMNGYHSLPADRTNIPSQEYFEGPDSRPHVSQSYYPRSEEFLPNIPGTSFPSRGPAYQPGEERVPPVPPVRKSSFQQVDRGDQLPQDQGPVYQPYSNDESRVRAQPEWERDYQPYQTSETSSRIEPAMPLTQLESQILPSTTSSQSFSPQFESQIQPDVSNRSYSAIPKTVQRESRTDTIPQRRSEGSRDRSASPSQHSKTEPKVQKLDMGKFKMFEQKEPIDKHDSEKEKSKSMSHLHRKLDDIGEKDNERTRSTSHLHKKSDDKREKDSERARSTSHLHMKPDTLPKLQAYGQPDIMRSSLSTPATQGAPIKHLHSKRVDEDPINFRELLTKFQSPQEEEAMETEEKKIVQAELNQVLASRAKVLEDMEYEDLPRAVRRLKKDMDECGEWIRVRVHQMEPDLMEVGSTLEEALQLQQEHDQLLSKLQAKEEEIKQLLSRADSYTAENPSEATVYAAMSDTLAEAWRDLNDKLDYRRRLLAESVTFHQKANYFATQMEQAQTRFMNLPLATDVDSAKRQLRQHQEIKQDILEASKSTLDLGHSLLERIKEMGMHADFTNRHATTAACYGIEHLIELLQDRRRRLEDLWEQRRIRLEQSLQLFQLDQEVNKVLGWYRSTGTAQLKRTELGDSYESAKRVQEEHHRFEQEARDIQDTVLRLVRTADQLLRRTHLDAEGVRQRLQAVDEESENFMNKLDTRRKNISMAMSFYGLAETAQTKLEEIEVRINTSDLQRNSAELADRHSQLSNVIVEVSTSALSEGHLLLERVSREDFGADGVRRRMEDLQQRCERLESLCKARRAEAWERSQTYLSFQEQYTSLQTWVTQIVLARLSQHSNMGTTLQEGHDFLEIHEHLEEDISDKSAEIKRLSEAVVSLVKSGDQEANSAAEKVDHLTKQIQRLHRVTEVRIKLSLLYVSFHRLLQQNSNCMKSLEHILKSETENLQDLTDTAVLQTEELWSQVESSFRDLDDKGREFLKNSSTITDDETLQIRHAISTVEFLMTETRDHMTHLTTQWDSWQTHVSTSRQFKTQWHQFIQDARKSIDRVLHLENEFFPVLAGDLGSSMDTANEYQRRLDNFMPEFETIDQVMLIEKDFFAPNIAGDLGSSLESAQELQEKLQKFEPIAKVEQTQRTMLAAMTMP